MKAILVIDMPKRCEDCELFEPHEGCPLTGSLGGMEEDCPLKPLPKMVEVPDDAYVSDYLDFDLGWNACLKEITRETK